MYDYKYKKEYKYKQLNRKKLEELKDVIENIDGLNVKSINVNLTKKTNKLVEEQKQEFKNFNELFCFLDGGINRLEDFNLRLITRDEDIIDLEFDRYRYNWELTYNKQTTITDSLILNLSNIFTFDIISFFKRKESILLLVCFAIQLSSMIAFDFNSYITIISSILSFTIFLVYTYDKCRPYNENAFIERNKDNLFFYILGVITPYIINLVIKLVSK